MIRTRHGSPNGKLPTHWTTDGGVASFVLVNDAGCMTQEGLVVEASAVGMSFKIAEANSKKPLGVVFEPGIGEGEPCSVVFKGLADVLLKDGTAAILGRIVMTSDVAGRATATTIDLPNPQTGNGDEMYQVLGIALENKSAGTDVLCKVLLT